MNTSLQTISRAYKVRLYPNKVQARELNRLFGARRFIWNWSIQQQNQVYQQYKKDVELAKEQGLKEPDRNFLSWVDLSREFTNLRNATKWLESLPRDPFTQTFRDLDKAWNNFSKTGARIPKRKRYKSVNSARFTLGKRGEKRVDHEKGLVNLSKIGEVKFRKTEELLGNLCNITVYRNPAGQWYGCFAATDVPYHELKLPIHDNNKSIGIDLGVKTALTLSNGTLIQAPRILSQYERRLKRYQRQYSRQLEVGAVKQGLKNEKSHFLKVKK